MFQTPVISFVPIFLLFFNKKSMMVITLAPIAAFLTHEMIRKYFPGKNIQRGSFFLLLFQVKLTKLSQTRFPLERFGRHHFSNDGGLCGPRDCLYVWLLERISTQYGASSPGMVVPKVVCIHCIDIFASFFVSPTKNLKIQNRSVSRAPPSLRSLCAAHIASTGLLPLCLSALGPQFHKSRALPHG